MTIRIVARIFSKHSSQARQTMEFIRPIVEERFTKIEEFGEDWDDAPPVRQVFLSELVYIHAIGVQNDMLMVLMKEAKVEGSLEGLIRKLIVLNFASILSTSNVGSTSSIELHVVALTTHAADVYTSIVPPHGAP